MTNPTSEFSLIDKAYKAGKTRLAHELLDLTYSDTETPATARNTRAGGGLPQLGQVLPIAAIATVAILVFAPFLMSPSDSQQSSFTTQSEVQSSD